MCTILHLVTRLGNNTALAVFDGVFVNIFLQCVIINFLHFVLSEPFNLLMVHHLKEFHNRYELYEPKFALLPFPG